VLCKEEVEQLIEQVSTDEHGDTAQDELGDTAQVRMRRMVDGLFAMQIDSDGSGEVSLAEFQAWWHGSTKKRGATTFTANAMFDSANGDQSDIFESAPRTTHSAKEPILARPATVSRGYSYYTVDTLQALVDREQLKMNLLGKKSTVRTGTIIE
jgi:hypothetical protein